MEILWRKTSRHRLVIFFASLAVATYFVPLQKFFTMGRYQHYGLAVGSFGLGYLLQTIWSWNIFTRWARLAYLATGLFALTVGITFFYSPWLDTKMCQPTPATELSRHVLMAFYLLFSFLVGGVYAKWIKEENSLRESAAKPAENISKIDKSGSGDVSAGGEVHGGNASGAGQSPGGDLHRSGDTSGAGQSPDGIASGAELERESGT